jgi:hypothetical protein
MQDFRDALYYPVQEFLGGGNPYRPSNMFDEWPVCQSFNLYQPFHLLLNAPFGLAGYRVGAVAFTIVNVALLIALSYVAVAALRGYMRTDSISLLTGTALTAALLLGSQVGKAQIYVGQINPLVALGAATALALRHKSPAAASVAFAMAWLKPPFGIPLFILLWARGSRRVAVLGTVIAVVFSLPVVGVLVARDGLGGFVSSLRANLDYANDVSYLAVDSLVAHRVDFPAVLFRATGLLLPAGALVTFVVVLSITVLLVRKLDREATPQRRAVADLLTMVGVIMALVHEPGDVLIAFPAMVLCVAVFRRHRDWLVGVALLGLMVPFVHLYFVDQVLSEVLGQRLATTVDGAAILCAWLSLCAAALRKPPVVAEDPRVEQVRVVTPERL